MAFQVNLLTPLLFASLYVGADVASSHYALAHGKVEVGMGVTRGALITVPLFIGADLLAQRSHRKWAPWVVRGLELGAAGWLVRKNLSR
jgi:hypothetical protein